MYHGQCQMRSNKDLEGQNEVDKILQNWLNNFEALFRNLFILKKLNKTNPIPKYFYLHCQNRIEWCF